MIIIERYRYFNNISDYRDYLSSLELKRIGDGSEGEAFLINNNEVLKIFGGVFNSRIMEDKKDTIIMAEDYNVTSFLLPKQLLIVNKQIVAYLSDYFPNNILDFDKPYNGSLDDINIDNLLKARDKMIKDTKTLTKDKVYIYDLAFNLLFDNKKLGAIDTFNYYRDKNVTLDQNIESIDYALLHELHFHDKNFVPDYNKSVEYNLKRIKK